MKHKDVMRSRVLCGHPAWLSCVIWVVMWGMWCICVRGGGSVSLGEESDGIDREPYFSANSVIWSVKRREVHLHTERCQNLCASALLRCGLYMNCSDVQCTVL